MSTLAERLKTAREEKGVLWTQAHLGMVAGVSTGTIGNIESGARGSKKPPASLNPIADALGVNYKWLAYGEEPKYPATGSIRFTGHATGATAPPTPANITDQATALVSSYGAMLRLIPPGQQTAAFAESIRALHAYIPQQATVEQAPPDPSKRSPE